MDPAWQKRARAGSHDLREGRPNPDITSTHLPPSRPWVSWGCWRWRPKRPPSRPKVPATRTSCRFRRVRFPRPRFVSLSPSPAQRSGFRSATLAALAAQRPLTFIKSHPGGLGRCKSRRNNNENNGAVALAPPLSPVQKPVRDQKSLIDFHFNRFLKATD